MYPTVFGNRRPVRAREFLQNMSLAAVVLALIGCTTQRQTPPPSPALPAADKKETGSQQNQSNDRTTASESVVPFVTQFEAALAKRDCSTIKSLEGQLSAPPENYSNSVTLAISWCHLQKSPQDKQALGAFVAAADLALKTEAPLFSVGFIEQLKADAYTSAGDMSSARASFSKAMSLSALQFMSLVSGQALRSDLQGIEPLLTGAQSALLKDVRSNLSDQSTQAAALTKLDELLSQVPQGPIADKLSLTRLKLFAAFELAFASQLGTLEEIRLRGDAAALDDATNKIRKLFPSRPHQARIDSIAGSNAAGKPITADSPTATPANQCAAISPQDVLNSTDRSSLTADKAMQLAKLALNDGKPGDAVEILDSLSETNKSDKTRSLRREASEAHIKELRRKASELYKRVTLTNDAQAKLDSLSQCKQILENILARYPETDSYTRRNVQKFLNSVSENITEIRKGQVK